jgi:hypothetical protein
MDEFRSSAGKGSRSGAAEKRSSKGTDAQQAQKSMEKQVRFPMNNAGVRPRVQRMSLFRDHGKRRIQICFRITEKAWERLTLISQLFQLSESDYCKATVYKDIGVWTERLDYRRKRKGAKH